MASEAQGTRRKVVIERTFNAPIDEVWELWTTSDGIESWWGPEGFDVKVHRLDLRPGGELAYAMTATAPEQMEFLKKAGMPLIQEARVTYTEVVRPRRLAFTQMADFIPNVKPYEGAMSVELDTGPEGVRMILTLDARHKEQWTRLAVMGWESELEKLARRLRPVSAEGR